jgi:hypothetical protein
MRLQPEVTRAHNLGPCQIKRLGFAYIVCLQENCRSMLVHAGIVMMVRFCIGCYFIVEVDSSGYGGAWT